jgi:hypothetical protein
MRRIAIFLLPSDAFPRAWFIALISFPYDTPPHFPDALPEAVETTEVLHGPTARKLRPDLIGNVETYPSFPVHVWPWQFVPNMIATGAIIRSTVAKKCRFPRIGDIRSHMAAHCADARMPFPAMR